MHHVVVEQWSRGSSFLHARDARAKLLATLVFLILVGTTRNGVHVRFALYALLLAVACVAAKLPVAGIFARALGVLPFSATFALVAWLTGDGIRALALLEKSYLSAAAALLLVASTPLPNLLRGLEALGVPRLLVLVVQFLYRYLFVISGQAQHMRLAAQCRAGLTPLRELAFRSAAGALSVLFARSYQRAEGIHRAMAARGFNGRFTTLSPARFDRRDAMFLAGAAALPLMVRFL